MAQTSADARMCVGADGASELAKAVGEDVKLCWETPYSDQFRYFRVRRSQTQEGFYDPFIPKMILADCFVDSTTQTIHGSTSFKAVRTYHYFVTAIYEVADEHGGTVLKETIGSQHVKVTVR